jgi:hypothetical protein
MNAITTAYYPAQGLFKPVMAPESHLNSISVQEVRMRLNLQPMGLFRNAEVRCVSHAAGKSFDRIETPLIRAKGSGEGEFHSKR